MSGHLTNTGVATVATAEVSGGQITAIVINNVTTYWYDGDWHPYPKEDRITLRSEPEQP
jgi:hypothetical protein